MATDFKCPVCGKVGIPNYLDHDTTCPCCGSDLSIFRVIDQLPQAKSNHRNIWKPIATAALVAVVVMGGFLISQKQNPSIANQDKTDSQEIVMLQDSISILKYELNAAIINQPQNDGIKYVIKNGDSFWSISRKIYGTGTRYEEIANTNGLAIDAPLHVGDTIIIK